MYVHDVGNSFSFAPAVIVIVVRKAGRLQCTIHYVSDFSKRYFR